MGAPSFNAIEKALACSAMLWLQLHSFMVSSADIVFMIIYLFSRGPTNAGSSSASRYYRLKEIPGLVTSAACGRRRSGGGCFRPLLPHWTPVPMAPPAAR